MRKNLAIKIAKTLSKKECYTNSKDKQKKPAADMTVDVHKILVIEGR